MPYIQITFTGNIAHIVTTDAELAYRFNEPADWTDDEDLDAGLYFVTVPAERVQLTYC